MNKQALRVLYHLMLGIKNENKVWVYLNQWWEPDCNRGSHPQIQKLGVNCKFRVFLGVKINNLIDGNFIKHGFYYFLPVTF